MPELGYEFDDGTGYRELNLYLVGLTVDGVTVWEKPKPKERVRVHPEREEHRRKMLFLQEEGDYDIYLAPDGADTYFYPRYFPAVYEER